jgi:predicted DNA-binding protein (UPF0251 family)
MKRCLDVMKFRRLAQRWSSTTAVINEPALTQQPPVTKTSAKGFEVLGKKVVDYSQYMHNLTEKQYMAFSLKFEYELSLTDIASRMGIDRKTAWEHIEAANRKIDQIRLSEKQKGRTAKHPRDR